MGEDQNKLLDFGSVKDKMQGIIKVIGVGGGTETSKRRGANVETDFAAEESLHTFAPSEDNNRSEDGNMLLTYKAKENMKKKILALVAMVMMAMSASAQQQFSHESPEVFDRMASYLELTSDQVKPVLTAIKQLRVSLASLFQAQDPTGAWEKIEAKHKETMKQLLTEKQYEKYEKMFDLTAKNTMVRVQEMQIMPQ